MNEFGLATLYEGHYEWRTVIALVFISS